MTDVTLIMHPDTPLRALSVRQPYAQLILPPGLRWEVRTWPTDYRGWVLICAGQHQVKPFEIVQLSEERHMRRMDLLVEKEGHWSLKGYALGVAYLTDCRPMTPEDSDRCCVKYKPGLYCHIFENAHRIIPFKYYGKPGYRAVDDYDRARIQFPNL